MSMYGMLFGESSHADVLLAMLGLGKADFYRFRNCHLTDKRQIAVYTRGGGGNRQCYCDDYAKPEERTVDFAGDLHALGCVRLMQSANRKHPCYEYDEDDDYDNTYATFYFRIPEDVDRAKLAEIMPELTGAERWEQFLSALKAAR